MPYTVSDFYWNYKDSLKLIAGESGLTNKAESCGILDYELIPNLKDKYFYSSFREKQIILTTFLYSKDNPFAIIDAVKQLNLKKAAALVIRNVFRLQIPENVIRYADAKNFPIIIIESPSLFFEDMVYEVRRQNELLADKYYVQAVLSETMDGNLSPEQIRLNALKLNMSFCSRFFCIYLEPDDFLTAQQIRDSIGKFRSSALCTHTDFISEFRKGILLIKSGEYFTSEELYAFVKSFFRGIFGVEHPTRAGISDIHNELSDLKKAIYEATVSAYFTNNDGLHYYYFEDIGIYRLVFTGMMNDESFEFSSRFMEPIEEYDMENRTDLLRTLCEFVRSDMDYVKTGTILSQHEQTIRYRIKRVCEIVGLSHKSQHDLEQLSIATKIYLARRMLAQ